MYLYKGQTCCFTGHRTISREKIEQIITNLDREMGRDVRLVFALPCKNQERLWNTVQKRLYRYLLAEADEMIYVSEEYSDGCMKKRSRYMVDHSAYCICARLHPMGVTEQTVKYARKKGLHIINVVG